MSDGIYFRSTLMLSFFAYAGPNER